MKEQRVTNQEIEALLGGVAENLSRLAWSGNICHDPDKDFIARVRGREKRAIKIVTTQLEVAVKDNLWQVLEGNIWPIATAQRSGPEGHLTLEGSTNIMVTAGEHSVTLVKDKSPQARFNHVALGLTCQALLGENQVDISFDATKFTFPASFLVEPPEPIKREGGTWDFFEVEGRPNLFGSRLIYETQEGHTKKVTTSLYFLSRAQVDKIRQEP